MLGNVEDLRYITLFLSRVTMRNAPAMHGCSVEEQSSARDAEIRQHIDKYIVQAATVARARMRMVALALLDEALQLFHEAKVEDNHRRR